MIIPFKSRLKIRLVAETQNATIFGRKIT